MAAGAGACGVEKVGMVPSHVARELGGWMEAGWWLWVLVGGGGLGRAPPNPLNQGVRTSRQRSNEGARRSDELVGGWY